MKIQPTRPAVQCPDCGQVVVGIQVEYGWQGHVPGRGSWAGTLDDAPPEAFSYPSAGHSTKERAPGLDRLTISPCGHELLAGEEADRIRSAFEHSGTDQH